MLYQHSNFERKGYKSRAFFSFFYTPGLISENPFFEGRNNQGLATFLRGSVRVYKQPKEYGGMDGSRTDKKYYQTGKGFVVLTVRTPFSRWTGQLT